MSSFTFGKFKQIPIEDVFKQNYYYVDWITKQPWFQSRFKEQYTESYPFVTRKKISTRKYSDK